MAARNGLPHVAKGEVMRGVALMSSAYLAPVEWYVRLLAYPRVRVERFDHYVKQTYRNRCVIGAESGRLALTVPTVDTGGGKTLMEEVRISEHGGWRRVHWNALEAAYRHSPFFDFYADELLAVYETRHEWLLDFNRAMAEWACRQIDIRPEVEYSERYVAVPDDADDFREAIHPKRATLPLTERYWQVFSEKNGFLPGLSIADLLFNMGPESLLVLSRGAEKLKLIIG